MTRQRQVHPSPMVAHLWANKAQDAARVATGNFFFTGPTIYSYGSHFPIAHHSEAGFILWNDSSYSNTTSGQQWDVRRALTPAQRDSMVAVPGLKEDDCRAFDRAVQAKDGRALDMVDRMASEVIATVLSIANMRKLEKMQGTLESARRVQENALRICAAVSGKKKAKWPVVLLPETVPADKLERAAFVRSYAKGEAIKAYKKAMVNALEFAIGLSRAVADNATDNYAVQNFKGRLNSIHGYLQTAANQYNIAHGRKSSEVAKLTKKMQALEPALLARVGAWELSRAKYDARDGLQSAFRHVRNAKTGATARNYRGLQWYTSRVENALQGFDADTQAVILSACGTDVATWNRLQRLAEWATLDIAFFNAVDNVGIVTHQIDHAQWSAAESNAIRTLRAFNEIAKHVNFYDVNHPAIDEHRATLSKAITRATGELAAQHADAKRAWLAGERVSLSYEAGTYARINGDVVETNRGARVPLEHACRLARLARRIIALGGKEWAQGDGPMVGHFRVNAIRADGSATVGCHEFDAAESARFLAVLESCAGCIEHAANVETIGA